VIATVLRISRLNLSRDRVAQLMAFVLPLAFFSIFALVFGQQPRRSPNPVRVALVDEDRSDASRAFVKALEHETALRPLTTARPRGGPASAASVPLDRPRAESLVKDGDAPAAVVLPLGFGAAFASAGTPPRAELLVDPSDPIATPLLRGLLQKAAATAQPKAFARRGLEMFEKYAGGMTPQQRGVMDAWLSQAAAGDGAGEAAGAGVAELLGVDVHEVVGQRGPDGSMVAFFAAGVGVMFLLFSCSAAGGALLEEVESGTLERLLSTPLGMGRLLAGKWLFITLTGVVQVTLMFAWGALVFGLELLSHLAGFALMTLATAGAAAGFGLVLATACRSRGQLSGIGTIVILMMSALGGSMFPRFLMSEKMQKLGLFTFNGWALDGYIKVFWRNAPLVELWPQLLVLVLLTAAFLTIARRLARRWETV
jgi:ABC-2 type transport system permease protein